jgi:hypothetical protein
MRIVTWNCNMALHRKAAPLLALKPDIAVVCECAAPDRLRAHGGTDWLQESPVWVGHNPHKGLAVLALGECVGDIEGVLEPCALAIA